MEGGWEVTGAGWESVMVARSKVWVSEEAEGQSLSLVRKAYLHGISLAWCLRLTTMRTSTQRGSSEQVVEPRCEENSLAREEEAVMMSNGLIMGGLI